MRASIPAGHRATAALGTASLPAALVGLLTIVVSGFAAAPAPEATTLTDPNLRKETNVLISATNGPALEAVVTNRLPGQAGDRIQTNDSQNRLDSVRSNTAPQAGLPGFTNAPAEPTGPGSSNAPVPGNMVAPSSSSRRPDYNSFRLIADRNIFNPNRFPRSSRFDRREFRRPARVDTFSLVGTMSYEKGLFAFFDGSSADYRKTTQPADVIAGFKVAGIAHDRVALISGTNTFELKLGMQMRREEEGDWTLAGRSEAGPGSGPPPMEGAVSPAGGKADGRPETVTAPSDSSSTATNAEPAAGGGSDSDVLKKLMERREKEMNK